MCNIYRQVYFSLKNVYKWARQRFGPTSLREKDSPWSGNTLFGKENVSGIVFIKEDHADNLLDYERIHHY